jgi:hypothetical protein
MLLGLIQTLEEKRRTGIFLVGGGRGKVRPERKADKLTAISKPIVWKMLDP